MVYDPCCGAGYLLTVLAYLHGPSIRAVAASDVDPIAVQLAERNLSLLTIAGVDRRIEELSADLSHYQKDSHREALESARRIRENISSRTREIPTRVFSSDAGDAPAMLRGLNGLRADIVITDIPYGRHSDWRGILRGEPHPSQAMLDALLAVISPAGVVAVAADKSQKIRNESFKRIDLVQIGKRRITILRPKD
jgi:tRNA G10  N-methylase Trm11